MLLSSWVLAAVVLVLSGVLTEGKTVVFLPLTITSHTRVHAIVAEELHKLGHEVWVALSSEVAKRKAESYKGVNLFTYSEFVGTDEDIVVSNIENSIMNSGKGSGDWSWIPEYAEILSKYQLKAMTQGGMLQYVKNIKPDLIVIDTWPRANELVAIPYALDVPFAIVSCLYDATIARVSFNPLAQVYSQLYFRTDASLYEQLKTAMSTKYPAVYDTFFDRGYINQVAPNKPYVTTNDLTSKAEVFVIENDHIIDRAQPILPNMKFVGGISSGPAKEIGEPFKSFIARSEKQGKSIALVTFGSLMLNFPEAKMSKLLEIIQKIKLNVIWRVNITSPDQNKILTSTWVPQNDLLGSKNTKVFLSHCGFHGQLEALYHAVPIVCIPWFFDQMFNAERADENGYGVNVDFLGTSVAEIVKIIEETASNDKLRANVKKASEISHVLYPNPRKEAAFWLDHVMRYGGSYMRYSGQTMPWKLYVLGDFLFFFAGIFITVLAVLSACLLRIICGRMCKKQRHMKND